MTETPTELEKAVFSQAELDLLRQWFNSLTDTNPKYLGDADRALMKRISALLQQGERE